jgi:hypothetical protein
MYLPPNLAIMGAPAIAPQTPHSDRIQLPKHRRHKRQQRQNVLATQVDMRVCLAVLRKAQ